MHAYGKVEMHLEINLLLTIVLILLITNYEKFKPHYHLVIRFDDPINV